MNEKPEALQFADDRPSSWNVDDLYQWATDAEEMIRSMQARITEMKKENAMQDKNTTSIYDENIILPIMGLVQEYADYERQVVRKEIESKLRELVENKFSVQKPLSEEGEI